MKHILLLLFVNLAFSSFSQKTLDEKWLDIPEDLKKNACAIIREYKVEYTLNSTNNLIEKVSKVITILDDGGKSNATQVWHYDIFSKFIYGEIIIYDKEGVLIEKKKLREMEDYGTSGMSNFFDDSRLKVYRPVIKETPFTVVINYSKKYNGFFQLRSWYPQPSSDIAVEKASLTIYNPNNVEFKIKQKNLKEGSYKLINEGNNKLWEMNNIKAYKPERYVKSSRLPSIAFPLKRFQVQGFAGNTESWEGFGKWSADLISDRDQLPEDTKIKILKMIEGVDDPKEKAKIIYSWMQENTRYISIQYGIGGWQPFEAAEVDNLKYGDCKGLTNYTKALFKVADIDAYYSLVYAGSGNKDLDYNFPSNQFNHIILCVPFDGDTTWVECTADNIALGYLGDFTDDRYALVIDGNQSKLVKTTAYSKEENTQIRTANIKINTDGSILSNIQTVFSGLQFKNRRAQVKKDEKDQKDYLYKTLDLASFTINNVAYDYKKEILPEIKEDIELEVPKYASVTSTRMFVPLNLLNKKTYRPEKDTARENKIYISMDYLDLDSLVYQIPEGYEIERLPKAKSFESTYGKYSSTISITGDKIIYVRKMEQNAGNYPADGWDVFRKYKRDIVKADKATAILRKIVN